MRMKFACGDRIRQDERFSQKHENVPYCSAARLKKLTGRASLIYTGTEGSKVLELRCPPCAGVSRTDLQARSEERYKSAAANRAEILARPKNDHRAVELPTSNWRRPNPRAQRCHGGHRSQAARTSKRERSSNRSLRPIRAAIPRRTDVAEQRVIRRQLSAGLAPIHWRRVVPIGP